MSQTANTAIAVIGIDIGKNSFHVVGHDARGAIVLRQKWSRGQVEARLANLPPCLIGMEACVGAHHRKKAEIDSGKRSGVVGVKFWEVSPLEADSEAPPDYMRHSGLQSGYWVKAWALRCECVGAALRVRSGRAMTAPRDEKVMATGILKLAVA